MNFSPNHAEMTNDNINANRARNDMYDQMCEPGMPNWSRNLKR